MVPSMRRVGVLVACFLGGFAPCALAEVHPKRASDVVTLGTAYPPAPCPASATALLFDTRILSDGTRAPFAIPAGKVLVVTGLDYVSDGVSGSAVAATLIHATSGEQLFTTVGTVHNFGVGSDVAHHSTAVPQLVVKGAVCLQTDSGTSPPLPSQGVLHGFLAPDR